MLPKKRNIVKTPNNLTTCLTNQSWPRQGEWGSGSSAAPNTNPLVAGFVGRSRGSQGKSQASREVGRGEGGWGWREGERSEKYGREEVSHYVNNWRSWPCINGPSVNLAQNGFQPHHCTGHIGAWGDTQLTIKCYKMRFKETTVLESRGGGLAEEEGFEVGPEGFSLAEGKGHFRRANRVNRWASVSLTSEAGPSSLPPGRRSARLPWWWQTPLGKQCCEAIGAEKMGNSPGPISAQTVKWQ